MFRIVPIRTVLPLFLAFPWITGCSGGSGTGHSTTVVLFVDEFDGARLAQHWVPSEPAAIDVAHGAMTIHDDGRRNTVTLLHESFAAADLSVAIRTAPPSDVATCQFGPGQLTLLIALLDAKTGDHVAGVMFLRWPCGNASQTTYRYWIGDPSIQFFEEHLPNGTVTGSFSEFVFRVDATGTATWSRDGVDKFVAAFDPNLRLGLRLSSGRGSPALPMRFDSVVVRRG